MLWLLRMFLSASEEADSVSADHVFFSAREANDAISAARLPLRVTARVAVA